MTPEDKLKQMGLELPPAPAPVAVYVPVVQVGDLAFTSGQLPMRDGKVAATGKVGAGVPVEEGAKAARLAVLNALSQLAVLAGNLSNVTRIVKMTVFVNSADRFTDQPKVANGASELLVELFGDAGRHARSAVGVNELPLNAAVEVELVAQVRS